MEVPMRMGEPVIPRPRRRPVLDTVEEAQDSLEDRRVIKGVLAATATVLFLLAVFGWL
jgi:hypothetical protein